VAAEVEGSGSEGRPLSTAQAVITPRNSVAIPIQILVIGLVPFDLFVLVSRNRQQRRTRQISGMHGDRISIEIANSDRDCRDTLLGPVDRHNLVAAKLFCCDYCQIMYISTTEHQCFDLIIENVPVERCGITVLSPAGTGGTARNNAPAAMRDTG
jgi:hypothetical protein